MPELRVIAWNIHEGKGLEAVASTLRNLRPDIVLLNEMRNPLIGTDQEDYLAQQCSLPYHKYESTTSMGITGTKGVAILSRYPLLKTQMHKVWAEGLPWPPTFGTLQATIQIDGLYHEVFTTRYRTLHSEGSPDYDETQVAQNQAGHKQAYNLVKNVPADRAVIFGGDFNANWHHEWAREFRDTSGLTDAVWKHSPDTMVPSDCQNVWGSPLVSLGNPYDYLYYRGPWYRVSEATMKCGSYPASDHPYVYATFVRTDRPAGANAAVVVRQEVPTRSMEAGKTYDVRVVMRNIGTNTWTPGGSNPYRLGSQNPQDNTYWGLGRVELPHSVAPGSEVTFSFKVTAPDVTNVVNFQWRMLREGIQWFGDFSPNVGVSVAQRRFSSIGVNPTPTPVRKTIQVTVRALDAQSGAPAPGTVVIVNPDEQPRSFGTNSPFTFQFNPKFKITGGTGGKPPVVTLLLPTGKVQKPNYVGAAIPFKFDLSTLATNLVVPSYIEEDLEEDLPDIK